tara:strand:- start:19746 stop:21128 length:1383 start_codon:yes stop_codon:yes gene_type:complete
MLKKIFPLTFFLFIIGLSSSLAAKVETIIQGDVKGFENKELKIGVYLDYITQTKEWIASGKIENGKFRIAISLDETRQLILKIEDKESSFFAKPGELYNLSIDFDAKANEGRIHDKFLNIQFPFPKPGDLNLEIKKFNTAYQKFFEENYRLFIINAAGKKIENFIEEWEPKIKDEESYSSEYIRYVLANLEDLKKIPKQKLFDKYLKNKPILYNQKEYFNFFTQLYASDFEQVVITKKGTELLIALMMDESLVKSKKLVKEIKGMENSQLAELYLINGLFEVYHKKVVNQKSSMKILEEIAKKGESEGNRIIAKNTISQLKKYAAMAVAPDFNLTNTEGKKVKLSDYKGSYVYLSFWSNASVPSLRELKVLQKFHEEYGKKIKFISINLDDDSNYSKNVKADNNYNWPFLHIGDDFELKEQYNIKTIPSYFLIDKNGKFLQTTGTSPFEIDRKLFELNKE